MYLQYLKTLRSTSRPMMCAQLMRVHVVTPKAPLRVVLRPRVQACPDGPVFHPGTDEGFRLPPNTCWVLRLPYIYWGKSYRNTYSLVPLKVISVGNYT